MAVPSRKREPSAIQLARFLTLSAQARNAHPRLIDRIERRAVGRFMQLSGGAHTMECSFGHPPGALPPDPRDFQGMAPVFDG
jgi:hypothetical protein